MRCSECGCTDSQACEDLVDGMVVPCHWVAPGLCSACIHEAERLYLRATGRAEEPKPVLVVR